MKKAIGCLLALLFVGLSTPAFAVDLQATVTRVIDGDTFDVLLADTGIKERVRIIGIDTPEIPRNGKKGEPFGREAEAKGHELLDGQRITLRLDKANVDDGHRDRYNRLLAHVILADGRFFTEVMISEGLGHAITNFDYDPDLKTRFLAVEQTAREAKIGIWSP
ncbi:MAG: thermonuclease family protein [Candidatus Alcyoniella australis]|nr:thermonuclease family protein [Candidatus Alcyoniella australis]